MATPRFFKDQIPELDGLRGMAVCLVLWVHLPEDALGRAAASWRDWIEPGYLGVDLFFVLSGFLITRILLVDRDRGVPLRYFLARRFLRIFPIYYLFLFSIQIVAPRSNAEFFACAFYYSNYAFPFIPGYSRLEHFWSLAVEEHFYLIWPPIVTFFAPHLSRRAILFGFFPLAIVSGLVLLVMKDWNPVDAPFELTARGSTTRFGSLALGALFAYHELFIRHQQKKVMVVVAMACALAALLSLVGREEARGVVVFLRLVSVPLVTGSLILLAVTFTGRSVAHAVLLRTRGLRAIGRISYGLYLYHFPIFRLVGLRSGEPFSPRILAALGVTFAVATISYLAIERPILNYARRFRVAKPVA